MSSYGANINVFINCPFDKTYKPIFQAIVFSIYDCGYVPRSALEDENGGEVRIEKLYKLIKESRFGVHDISRTTPDRGSKLPRFNMPLELGIFLGAKKYGGKGQSSKVCLILDSERFRYQKFISDIAGQDIRAHENKPEKAISAVRTGLAANTRGVALPGATVIVKRHKKFLSQLPQMCRELQWKPGELSHPDYEHLVSEWLKINTNRSSS